MKKAFWLAGVTGTNGKTSVSQWIAQTMDALGQRFAVVGTLGKLAEKGKITQAALDAAAAKLEVVARLDGLVLSSPALDAGMNAFQKLLVSVLPRLAPDLRVGNGLNAQYLSHDAGVVQAYRDDPMVHDRISARLARFIADAGPAVLASAPQWRVPTLLLFAGADHLVNPEGSRAFAAAAPPGVVSAHCFEGLYHEIFNEVDREAVFERLKGWLDARF